MAKDSGSKSSNIKVTNSSPVPGGFGVGPEGGIKTATDTNTGKSAKGWTVGEAVSKLNKK